MRGGGQSSWESNCGAAERMWAPISRAQPFHLSWKGGKKKSQPPSPMQSQNKKWGQGNKCRHSLIRAIWKNILLISSPSQCWIAACLSLYHAQSSSVLWYIGPAIKGENWEWRALFQETMSNEQYFFVGTIFFKVFLCWTFLQKPKYILLVGVFV